jgi:hypothetical protein
MGKESIYWFIVLLTFIYIIYTSRNSSVKLLIVLCFYYGLAAFPGKSVENIYKILLVFLSIYLLFKNNGLSRLGRSEWLFLIVFILFTVSFLFSAFFADDYLKLVFSQYGKYVTPICLFFVFNRILTKSPGAVIQLEALFFSLLTIQIVLSIVKILIIGLQESIVGSVAFVGGGPATILPVLGFILVWIQKQGDLKRKEWLYILLLIIIAFASRKRAIWFILPVIILIFAYYVPRKLKVSHLFYVLPLIPLIFYAGVRLNPTLNKEGKIGGTFDLPFVLDYINTYNFGTTSGASGIELGKGRGGATLLLYKKLFDNKSFIFQDYFGSGLKEVYTTDYEEFNEKKYGVNSKGSVTGVFQSYISSGYVGIIVTILLLLSICNLIKESRFRIAVALLLFWDYFFYIGLILRTQSLFILLFFIIIYSNIRFEQKMQRKYLTINPGDKIIGLSSQNI